MPQQTARHARHFGNLALRLTAAISLLAAVPALAQEATAPTATPPAQGPELAPSRADAGPGEPYLLGEFEDWTVRCARAERPEDDPCQMNQTLLSPDGSPTAEVNIQPLERDDEVAAGASFVTPLETLLTREVTLSVDGGAPRSYPFTFCARQGCVARVGFSAAEVDQFRAGQQATVTIYPAAAPDQPVELSLSLAGFTAAWDSLSVALPE